MRCHPPTAPGAVRCARVATSLSPPRAFTLVELLIVIAIISVFVALLLPAVNVAREAARRTQCSNHLRQIGIGLSNHETAHGAFPIGCLECDFRLSPPRRQIAWTVSLLPFMEYQSLGDQFDWQYAYRHEANRYVVSHVIPELLCPSTTTTDRAGPTTGDINGNGVWEPGDDMAYTDYGGLFGVSYPTPQILPSHLGVMVYEEAITARQITDGLSQTAIVGECTGRDFSQQSEWSNGQNIFDQRSHQGVNVTQDNELWSDHPGGVQVVFCDGHVQYLAVNINQEVLNSMLTRQGNEVSHAL